LPTKQRHNYVLVATLPKAPTKLGPKQSGLHSELNDFSLGWRRSADRTCLQANSLETGNFTRNLAILAARRPDHGPENAVVQRLLSQFPVPTNREFCLANRDRRERNPEVAPAATETESVRGFEAWGIAQLQLALNILVTFAQFERELIGERIRDKVAASRKRGKWMGGWAPLGYEVRERKLIVRHADAERVRHIFRRFVQLKSATLLARELVAAGERNRYGHLLDKAVLYRLLSNRVYIGEAVHKEASYPGEHEAIIDRTTWNQVRAIIKESPRKRANGARAQSPALLKGLVFGPDGAAMSPTHTRKSGRLYRYYISQTAIKRGRSDCPVRQVPAAEIERIVLDQIRVLLRAPEVVVQTWRAARKQRKGTTENDVRAALVEFDELWNELFSAEQARIVELLVDRIDLRSDKLDLTLRIDGLTSLYGEMRGQPAFQQAAE
jgi:site-specific DNA recombinase